MKKLFLISNTKYYHKENDVKVANEIDNTNKIVDQMKNMLERQNTILFIVASFDDYEKVDFYSKLIFDSFKFSGFDFENYLVLDRRTADLSKKYVENTDLIFLSGGDIFIENEFFKDIKLKELLENYQRVIVGQSAGSINLASNVYNSPEDGNETDIKTINFDGLGLSNINIEPHFEFNDELFDENELYQRRHILINLIQD